MLKTNELFVSVWINTNLIDDFRFPPKAVEPSPPKRARVATDVLIGASHSRNKLPKHKMKRTKEKDVC